MSKIKKFTHGVSFSVSEKMYRFLKNESDRQQLGLGELMRSVIEQYQTDIEKGGGKYESK